MQDAFRIERRVRVWPPLVTDKATLNGGSLVNERLADSVFALKTKELPYG